MPSYYPASALFSYSMDWECECSIFQIVKLKVRIVMKIL